MFNCETKVFGYITSRNLLHIHAELLMLTCKMICNEGCVFGGVGGECKKGLVWWGTEWQNVRQRAKRVGGR